jgi:3-oxoacyl-[acyl-carrier-protein] synthase III
LKESLRPAGIRSLAITIPTGTRHIQLPNGAPAVRHFMTSGQSGLDLEKEAALQALAAAELDPADVDLVISASFPALPEPCIGNATPLAWELGMTNAAAFNVESACAGGLIGLRNACQEVRVGEQEKVLLTVACPYSPTIEAGHPATDVIGDAAYAMVIAPTRPGQEFLGSVIKNSGPTCDLVSWAADGRAPSGIRLQVGPQTAGQLEAWALAQLPEIFERLLARTGIAREEIRHWVVNAPTMSFVGRALDNLGARRDDGVDINRIAGNIGPSLIGVSLFYNAWLRDFQPEDVVLCCSVGSKSSLALTLMRWPEDVALGEVPAHASLDMLRDFESQRLEPALAAVG